ncbi:MAG TPA: chemotaxis protein CheW [Gemmatimonadaceae bacterium]|nr:chemotaxis protein CheW [Gemmatimonadaceae bacterium]
MASTSSISEPSTTTARRTLLFRVGNAVYGCDLADVREIIPHRKATRLPGAPASVQGLINLRGTIVTVIDLGARLLPGSTPVTDGSIILTGAGARVAGIAVEEVLDVRLLGADSSAALAVADEGAVAGEVARDGVVRGLGQVDGIAVILIDIHTLVKQVLLS